MTDQQLNFVLHLGVALLMIGVGFPLWRRMVPPNRWYGFRTPATCSDTRLWYPCNRVAGIWLMLTGAAMAVTCLATFLSRMPVDPTAFANVGVMFVFIAAMLVHSFVLLYRLKRNLHSDEG